MASVGDYESNKRLVRKDPDWIYIVRQEAIQIPRKRWYGTSYEFWYKIDIRGRSLVANETDTDYMVFDNVLPRPLVGVELEKFIDEQHSKVRSSKAEQDWDKLERERIEKEQAAHEARRKREFEEQLAREKAEIDRKMKEAEEKKKIGPV